MITISKSMTEDKWQKQAADVAIETARKLIYEEPGGGIPPGVPIGRLSEMDWGKITGAILFGWITVRAEQASHEGLDTERAIHSTALDPDPWDIGAIIASLPELAKNCPNVDWSKPLGAWGKEELAEFLLKAMQLIELARIARDINDKGVTSKSSATEIRRQCRGRIQF